MDYKAFQIGVPRTGTVYRENTMVGLALRGHYYFGKHNPVSYFTEANPNENDFVFAFVRNPFDLLVSHYEFIKRPDVQKHHPDAHMKDWTFREYLNEVSTRYNGYPNCGPLFFQLYSHDGRFIPDYLGRFETMEQDINEICRLTGCGYNKKDKINASTRKDYKEYYDSDMKLTVQRVWGGELNLFKYKW